MSNEVVPAGGGGAVVPATAGGAVGEHVGDITHDRGAPQTDGGPLVQDLQRATGLAIGRVQFKAAEAVLVRYHQAKDQRDRSAAWAAIKAQWGAATEGNLIKIDAFLLDTMGKELAYEFMGARDGDGTGICNKPAVLEALFKAAQVIPAKRAGDNNRGAPAPDKSAISSARLRELDSWLSNRDPRYWKDEAAQTEYRALLDRRVTADVMPSTADADVDRRIREIDSLMGNLNSEYYRGPVAGAIQQEYRDLLGRREQRGHVKQ
jgi:hypothetical protein